MRMDTRGLMALIHSEGVVLSRYLDSVGVWTIGVGHTASAGGLDPRTFKGTLTMQQVIDLLRDDVAKFERRVRQTIKVPITQDMFNALVHFDYNTGGIHRAKLADAINAGKTDRRTILAGFMGWTRPASLKGRREVETAMFFGEYPPETATLYRAGADGRVDWRSGRKVNVRQLLERSSDTVADLRAQGSRTIRKADMLEAAVSVSGGVTVVEKGLGVAERVQSATERGASLYDAISQQSAGIVLVVAVVVIVGLIWWIIRQQKKLRLHIHQTGEHI